MASSDFKNLKTRTVTGLLFLILALLCIWYNEYSFIVLFGLVTIGCLSEFYKLSKSVATPQYINGMLAGIFLYVLSAAILLNVVPGVRSVFFLFAIIFYIVFAVSMLFVDSKKPFVNLGVTLFGLMYAVLPFICLLFMGINPETHKYHYRLVLGFLLMMWANDTFAYLFGRFFGRTKLAKKISPGKTVEGALGGAVGAMAVCYFIMENWLNIGNGLVFEPLDWWVVCFITVVFGVLGDLVESKLKRSLSIKNSSNFFPGHGGFLDRFDSLLLSAPLIFVYIMFFKYSFK